MILKIEHTDNHVMLKMLLIPRITLNRVKYYVVAFIVEYIYKRNLRVNVLVWYLNQSRDVECKKNSRFVKKYNK